MFNKVPLFYKVTFLLLVILLNAIYVTSTVSTPTSPCNGDPNAHRLNCGDPCPKTCENMFDIGVKPCPRICIINGCKCNKGYVLNMNGKCILPKHCPLSPCNGDPNAMRTPCGDPCPITCENMNETSSRPCPAVCIINGCKCKSGYVRDRKGKCILPKNCPKRCAEPNMEYRLCGPSTPPTCNNLNPELPWPYKCVAGCFCKSGHVLNCKKKCIKIEDCWLED